jgi:hypothetical protein
MARKSRSARRSREAPAIKATPPAIEAPSPAIAGAPPVMAEASPTVEPPPPAIEVAAATPEAASPVVEAVPSIAATSKPRRATLAHELADFLVEFSIVLHKRSMYPAGHPHLQDSADRFVRRMSVLLDGRESVTLGVARHRLVIETVTTDANNALLRDLAHRLHRHRIASVHFTRGATSEEIECLLSVLSADPQRGDGPVGKRLDRVGPWSHIRLQAVGYDKFALQDTDAAAASDPDELESPRDSWIELAQLALANEDSSDVPKEDPLVVAEAIDRKSGEVAYDRVVLGYLARVAEEMSGRRGLAEDQLLQKISKLIEALDPDTLRRLLEAGADHAERRKFVLNASQILAADVVMEVVEAAAKASHQTISDNLLRLLHKLAHHAEEGPAPIRVEAESALRTNVARLIGDWELEDPNPTSYNAILEGMVRRSSAEYSMVDIQLGCDPAVIIRMALELDCVGPAVYSAVNELISRGDLVRLAELLKAAPRTSTSEELWSYVATPERLESELAVSPLNPDAVAILVERIGTAAADSLLERLASADDRSTRAAIMKQLLALGPGIGAAVVKRLPNAPWFLQRNILVLLGRLGSWPDGFSPVTYVAHSDPRIRREAIKLLLESGDHQPAAVMMGLVDIDDGIVALALAAALESCPPEAVPSVQRIAIDPKRPSELRVLAARIVTRARTPDALRVLLGLIALRRRWFGRRMSPKSPELLAALCGLAAYWRDDPAAAEVLAHARQHSDPDIRAAAASPAA